MAQQGFLGTIGYIKGNLMSNPNLLDKGYSNENFYPGAESIPESAVTHPKRYKYIFVGKNSDPGRLELPMPINNNSRIEFEDFMINVSSIAWEFWSLPSNAIARGLVMDFGYQKLHGWIAGNEVTGLPLNWVTPNKPTSEQMTNLSNGNHIILDLKNGKITQNGVTSVSLDPTLYNLTDTGIRLDIRGYQGYGAIKVYENDNLVHYYYPTINKNNQKCYYDARTQQYFAFPVKSDIPYYFGPELNI